MQIARLRKLVEDAAERGAARALCNQCVFDREGIEILNTVVKVGIRFKGFIILGLAISLCFMSVTGIGVAYIILSGGLG